MISAVTINATTTKPIFISIPAAPFNTAARNPMNNVRDASPHKMVDEPHVTKRDFLVAKPAVY
jgi:hypothetical protein